MKQGSATGVKGAILSHTLVNGAGTALTLGINAIILIWLYRDLGLAGFGAYSLINVMATHFHLFDPSLGAWLTRTVSARHHGNHAAFRLRMSVGVSLYLLAGLPVLALILAVNLFGLGDFAPRTLVVVLVFGTAGYGVCLLVNLCRKILQGRERFALIKACDVGTLTARLAGLALVRYVWPVDDRLPAYALILVLSLTLQAAALLGPARRIAGRVTLIGLRRFRRVARKAVRFAMPVFSVQSTALFSHRLDLWLVAYFLTPEAVGLYGFALRLHGLVTQAVMVSSTFLLPLSVRLKQHFSAPEYRDFILRATALSMLLTLGAATVLVLNLESILTAWFGPASLAAAPATLLLLFHAATTSLYNVGETVLMVQGRYAVLFKPFLAAALLNFAVSIWCTAFHGVIGPAVGTALGGVFLLVTVVPRLLETLAISLADYLRSVVPGVLVWMAAAGLTVPLVWPTASWPELLAATLAYVVLHTLLYYLVLLNPADRLFLRGFLRCFLRCRRCAPLRRK